MYFSSSDDDDDIIPPVFAISGERRPEDGPPTNGEEYLMQVRWEAKQLPKIFLSNINPREYDNNQTTKVSTNSTFLDAPFGMEISEKWQIEFLQHFKQLREEIEENLKEGPQKTEINFPHIKDQKQWFVFCFGSQTNKRKQEAISPDIANTKINGKEEINEKQNETQSENIKSTEKEELLKESQIQNSKKDENPNRNGSSNEKENNYKIENSNKEKTNEKTEQIVKLQNQDIKMKDSKEIQKNDTENNDIIDKNENQIQQNSEPQQQNNPKNDSEIKVPKLPNDPLLGIILSLDAVSTRRLLSYFSEWTEELSELNEKYFQWLFAVLCRVDWPIDSEIAWNLRTILKRLCQIRSQLIDVEDSRLPHLNILITIIHKYFEQQ